MQNASDSSAPLYTCHGRAVGLKHDWQGGHAMTESGYGKRVQLSPLRPLPSLTLGGFCGLITTIPGRDFRFAKAPKASKFAPGEFVIFSAPASLPHYINYPCNKCQSAINTVASINHSSGLGHGPCGLRPAVGAALAANLYPFATKVAPTGHYLRHASRRAIDLASNAAHER